MGEGEPGLEGVAVSDGFNIALTDDAGLFTLGTISEHVDYVTVTVPSGYRVDLSTLYRYLPDPEEWLSFGLHPLESPPGESLRLAVATDSHLAAGEEDIMRSALDAMASTSPHLILATGDINHPGTEEALLAWADGVAAFHRSRRERGLEEIPVLPVSGNHEGVVGDTREAYLDLVGPWNYSFDFETLHIAAMGYSAAGPETSLDWLARDMSLADPSFLKILLFHYVPNNAVVARLAEMGVSLVLSGHFHGARDETIEGVRILALQPLLQGGLDASPPGYRVIDIENAALQTRVITLSPSGWVKLVHPYDGALVGRGVVRVLAEALEQWGHETVEVSLTLNDVPVGALEPLGGWGYEGWLDLEPGRYTLAVGLDEGTRASSTFDVVEEAPSSASTGAGQWPEMGGGPQRTGWVDQPLVPPLRPDWVQSVDGTVRGGLALSQGALVVSRLHPGGLDCLRAEDGAPLWSLEMSQGVGAPPAICERTVVAVDISGWVVAADLETGQVLWEQTIAGIQTS